MLVHFIGKIPGVLIDYFVSLQVDFLFTSFLFSAGSDKTLGDKLKEPSSGLRKRVSNPIFCLTPHISWGGCVRSDSRDCASFTGLQEGKKEENKNSVTENG